MAKSSRYTEEEFKDAWLSSHSIAEVARKIGLTPAGGNYRTINTKASALGLNSGHMTGQGHLKGKSHNFNTRPIEELLVEGKSYNSSHLRLRLLRDGIFDHKCYNCNITEWLGKPAPLELEHINGVHSDNRIENLTLLCPNCHAQTPTYRGRNKARVGQR